MKRRLSKLLAVAWLVLGGISLALWLALMALWVDTRLFGHVRTLYSRPIYGADGVGVDGRVEILCWKEGFRVQIGQSRMLARMGTKFDHWTIPGASLMRMSARTRGYEGHISHWLAMLALGLPTVAWLIALRMMWRHRHPCKTGFCDRCGYDLRATPDRCPECGRETNQQAAA